MIWSLLLPVSAIVFFVYSRRGSKIHRHGRNIRKAPNTLPLLGNAIKFLQPRHVLFDWFVQCQRVFGYETLRISVPFLPPGVVISDPKNLEFVLKNENSITKGDFFKERSWDLFGHGIINASGEMWKAQRKAGLKFFSGTNLEFMVDEVLPDAYSKTVALLREAARDRTVVDMQEIFLDFTTSVVGQLAYDMDIDSSSPFSRSFDYASDQIGLRFQNPLYYITELFTGSKFRAAVAEVKKFGAQIVTNARKRRSRLAFESLITTEEPAFGSLIDSLIETFRDPNIVADSALNFLSAGRDTTAQSFTWTLYAIMRHPQVIGPLRQEIRQIFPPVIRTASATNPVTKSERQPITATALQPSQIPVLLSTFHEALRLYPPVPFELKQCEQPTTLPDGTFLPESSIVIWCIWAMNRSVQVWGSDSNMFRPNRWLDESGKLISKSAYDYPVFNGGPRACLGKKMAELMGCYLLGRLLSEFDFEEVMEKNTGAGRKAERVSQNSLTLPMKDGLPCLVKTAVLQATVEDEVPW